MRRISDIVSSPRFRRVAADVAAAAVAIAVALAVVPVATTAQATVGPVDLVLWARPALSGITVIGVPPFGEVRAKTHRSPVALYARVERIDLEEAKRSLARSARLSSIAELLPDEVGTQDLRRAVWRSAIVGLLAAVALAAAVVYALRRRRLVTGVTALVVALAVSSSFAVAASTWKAEGFAEPELTGSLAYLPRLADVFSYRVARIERLRGEAVKVANSIAAYYADDRAFAAGGEMPDTFRVLHVTDLHLDAVGAELGASIARAYRVSLVIDTGDAPILGAEIEGEALRALMPTDVPRIYVPGNHDSPATSAVLSGIASVTVLTTGSVEVAGLRIHAVPDPIARSFGVEPDEDRLRSVTDRAVGALRDELRSGEPTPDIVAIHNPAMEAPFVGLTPLIVSGHSHAARLYISRGTVLLNSGTLGGMPYDPSRSGRRPRPHSASVLYYSAELPRRLLAIDRIEVHANRTTTVTRRVLSEEISP